MGAWGLEATSARTHVFLAGQFSPSTHRCLHCWPAPPGTCPCLHCWPAPSQHTSMFPLLIRTSQHTPMSPVLAGTRNNEYAFAGMKIPRVLPQSGFFLQKETCRPGSLCNCLIGNQEPGRQRKNRKRNRNNNAGQGSDAHAQGSHTPFRSPVTLMS